MKHLISLVLAAGLIAAAVFVIQGGFSGGDAATSAGSLAASAGPGGRAPGGGAGEQRGGRASMVTLAEVEVTPYSDIFRSVGTLEAATRVDVESEVSGQVTAVHIKPNTEVAAGDVLVELDSRAAELDLASAEAQLDEARDALERYETLRNGNSGAVSQVALQEARTAAKLAEVAVDQARYELDRRRITAPISGTVGLTDIEVGGILSAGTEIVTITDTEEIQIDFTLPERAASVLEAGMPVRLTLPSMPGRVFEGEVAAFDNRIDAQTRLIRVEARIANDDARLIPGAIANVIVARESKALPSVPALSITWSREGASVWVEEDGAVRAVPVTIAHRLDDTVWVEGDLAAGAQVVVEGVQNMRPGATVTTGSPSASGADRTAGGGARPAEAVRVAAETGND
ncbi:efflux RND transporter periplasmic adaptor subunit [Halovulum sp. GXIMD14794]